MMATPEIQKAIGRLKLLLASVRNKQDDLESLSRDFRKQMERATASAIHGDGPLDLSLSAMGEIEERLQATDTQLRHLTGIRARAQAELDALELTKRIEKAKDDLAALRERREAGSPAKGDAEEMRELERFIADASLRAGRNITGRGRTPTG